jgi:hypothetical protein
MWPFNRKKSKESQVPKNQNPPPVPPRRNYGGHLGFIGSPAASASPVTPPVDNTAEVIMQAAIIHSIMHQDSSEPCRHESHSHDHGSSHHDSGSSSNDSSSYDSGSPSYDSSSYDTDSSSD